MNRRIVLSPLAAIALASMALAFAPEERRDPPPPERRPPPPKPDPREAAVECTLGGVPLEGVRSVLVEENVGRRFDAVRNEYTAYTAPSFTHIPVRPSVAPAQPDPGWAIAEAKRERKRAARLARRGAS